MPHADPDVRKAYHADASRRWADENRDRKRETNRKADRRRKGTPARKAQLSEVRIRRHIRDKVRVVEAYGGCCAFCGDDRFEVLTVDHIAGGGTAHRREIAGKYRNLYDFLARTDVRRDLYRLLCGSCHLAHTNYDVGPGRKPFHPLAWWREFAALRRPKNGAS